MNLTRKGYGEIAGPLRDNIWVKVRTKPIIFKIDFYD